MNDYIHRCPLRWLPNSLHLAWHWHTLPRHIPEEVRRYIRPGCYLTHRQAAYAQDVAKRFGLLKEES